MRIEASGVTQAPVDEVWQWWTDYGQEGASTPVSHGVGTANRRVVERDGNRLVLVEEWTLPLRQRARLLRHEITLHEDEHRIDERAAKPVPYEARWYFEPVDNGQATRVRRVMESNASAAEAFGRVAKPLMRSLAQRDLTHHLHEFEEERATP